MRRMPLSSGFKASTTWHGGLAAGDDVNVRERFTSGFLEGDIEFMICSCSFVLLVLNAEGIRLCGML
jgi:hypothetical protein